MCRAVTCRQCGKPTWTGCGKHVEQVLGDVPTSQRCRCEPDGTTVERPRRGLLSRILGRGGGGDSV